jgi:hypothetical protein
MGFSEHQETVKEDRDGETEKEQEKVNDARWNLPARQGQEGHHAVYDHERA